jgi:hypothetical protein
MPLIKVGLEKPLSSHLPFYASMAEQYGFTTHKPPFLGFILILR